MAVPEETKQEVPVPTPASTAGFVVKTNFIGKLRGIISSSSPKKLIAFAAIGFLIIVLPLAVIMSQRVQETRQRASEASRIEITGPNVANGTATSRNVKLKLTYVPVAASPTQAQQQTQQPTAAAGQQTFEYNLSGGTNVIGIPIQESRTVKQILDQTITDRQPVIMQWAGGTSRAERQCTSVIEWAPNATDRTTLNDNSDLVGGRAYEVYCQYQSRIEITGTPFTQTADQLKARLAIGTQWISLGTNISYSDANDFFNDVTDGNKICNRVRRGEATGGGWGEIKERSASANPFAMNDPKQGFEVVCQASSAAQETVEVKLQGAVALQGGTDKDADRFTKDFRNCPAGLTFKTGADVVVNQGMYQGRWDCQPMFYFGDTPDAKVHISKDVPQKVVLTPPSGYKCVANTVYGDRKSDSFDANACTVTITYDKPSDSFIWFKLASTTPTTVPTATTAPTTAPTASTVTPTVSTTSGVQGVATAQEASTTLQFRVSNDQSTLEQAQAQSFTPEELTALTKEIDWQLTEGNGAKTVFAQFKFGDAAWESVLSTTVTLTEATAAAAGTGQSWSFSSDFSGVQGQRDLYYKRFTIVVGARGQSSAGGRYGEAIWDSANNKWVGQSGVDDTNFAIAPGSLAPSVQSDAVVRWVAPQGGNVSISGAFKRCCIDTDPNQADKNIRTIYSVSKGDNQAVGHGPALWSKTVDNAEIQAWVGNNNTIATHDFSLTADVEAGNYIEFQVDPGEDGSGWDGSTVSFTITYNSTTQASTPASGQTTSAATQQAQQTGGQAPTVTTTQQAQQRGQESIQFAVVKGWNWIGWPFEENKKVSDFYTIVEGAHGSCSTIETAQGKPNASVADTTLGRDDYLIKGRGYKVQCSQPAAFYIMGTLFNESWGEFTGRIGPGLWDVTFARGMTWPSGSTVYAQDLLRIIESTTTFNYTCTSISTYDEANQRINIYSDAAVAAGSATNFNLTAAGVGVTFGLNCKLRCTPCRADNIQPDGIVGPLDYSLLANGGCWGKTKVQNPTDWTNNSCSNKDLDGNEVIDIKDYSCLASQWNQSCPEHRR